MRFAAFFFCAELLPVGAAGKGFAAVGADHDGELLRCSFGACFLFDSLAAAGNEPCQHKPSNVEHRVDVGYQHHALGSRFYLDPHAKIRHDIRQLARHLFIEQARNFARHRLFSLHFLYNIKGIRSVVCVPLDLRYRMKIPFKKRQSIEKSPVLGKM